ncbi:hypothetical protein JQC92_17015 [Shewanella sp. 202IG2-18]|uniref:hypothetical protein n=1 Tax=Parashewanella hymeniacidonis TaxID=2807618 RepID=UPI0019606004|nr:hypothetical protein [Parashewanella hymeniacidonis]MBM7073713.1 hypothetical protein [Parashewanella hymeniacidonis]
MALQDLKKQAFANRRKKLRVNAEEFIEQASLYAQGIPTQRASNYDNVIDFATGKPTFVMLGRVNSDENTEAYTIKNKTRYKNATFSLSYQAIEQLNLLAQETQLAKSHILRILIEANAQAPLNLAQFFTRNKTR